MRVMIAAVVLMVGCGQPAPPDAAVDAVLTDPDEPVTFAAPVGAYCHAPPYFFCSEGAGWCVQEVCRAQCNAIPPPDDPPVPRCAVGAHAFVAAFGLTGMCVCIPD